MAEKTKQPKEGIPKDLKDLVIARLDVFPSHKTISIGSLGQFTKDELIECVEQGNEVGEKIVEIELFFLRALKEGTLLEELISNPD